MESGGKTTQIFSTFKERFRTDQSTQSTLASKIMFAMPEQHKTSQALLVFSSQTSHFLSILCYKDQYFVKGRIVLVDGQSDRRNSQVSTTMSYEIINEIVIV